MNYKWVDEDSAKNLDCPFGQSFGVGEITCSGIGCMAWVPHPENKTLGRCGMMPGWEEDGGSRK
jgi:hypothetical protein